MQSLLQAAGHHHSDINQLNDSPIKTRLRTKVRARLKSAQVVIERSDEPRRSRRLLKTEIKPRASRGTSVNGIEVATSEPSQAGHQERGSDILLGESSSLDPGATTSHSARNILAAEESFVQKGLPGARRKRSRLWEFRRAIEQVSRQEESTWKTLLLIKLKTLKDLESLPQHRFLKQPYKEGWYVP